MVLAQDRPCALVWTKNNYCSPGSSAFSVASVNGTFEKEHYLGGQPNQIALSSENPPRIYWTDTALGAIRRSDLSFSGAATLINGLTSPQGIAIDTIGGYLFWSENRTPSGVIRRANIDGSNPVDLVDGIVSPRGITLDLVNHKIYWSSSSFGIGQGPDQRIERADLNGNNREEIVNRFDVATGGNTDPMFSPIAVLASSEKNKLFFLTSEDWVIAPSFLFSIGFDQSGLTAVSGLPGYFFSSHPYGFGVGKGLSLAEAQSTGEIFIGQYEATSFGGTCRTSQILRFDSNLSNPAFFAGVVESPANSIAVLENSEQGCVATRNNFAADNAPQIAVWRPNFGQWYGSLFPLSPASPLPDPILFKQWGLKGDLPFLGNFDGNGGPDLVVWRPREGNWYLCGNKSEVCDQTDLVQWGLPGDFPVPADFDGDRLTDFAIWRPTQGVWYYKTSRGRVFYRVLQWGLPGDLPLAADFNSDGKDDFVVWRPRTGTWYVRYSTAPSTDDPAAEGFTKQWGLPEDHPFVGDYDGDQKPDFVVWRPSSGTWYVCPSVGGYDCRARGYSQQFGLPNDIPLTGDLDADGKTDFIVWRGSSGNWYVRTSSTGEIYTKQFGLPGDIPLGYGPKSITAFQ